MSDAGLSDTAPPVAGISFPPRLGGGWHDLPELLQERACAISIYLPLEPENRDLRAPDARLRNLIDTAAERIGSAGIANGQGELLLDSARQFAAKADFTRHRPAGLALLIGSDWMRALDLPKPVDEIVVVGHHFHIKPLLNLAAHNQRFLLLALSRGNVELWAASPFHRERLPLDLPNEALQAELDSRPAADMTPGQAEAARRSLLLKDPQLVAAAVRHAIADRPAPMVLAGDPQATGEFTKIARIEQILSETLQLNPFALDEDALHRRAVEIIAPAFDAERDSVLDLAQSRLGTAEHTVAIRLEEILQAARDGRVDCVVVASDQAIWGRYRPGEVPQAHGAPKGEDEDLLNLAAVWSLRNGGRAFAMPIEQIPRRSPAIATLRF